MFVDGNESLLRSFAFRKRHNLAKLASLNKNNDRGVLPDGQKQASAVDKLKETSISAALRDELAAREAQNLYRRRRTVESAQGRLIRLEGRELLNFCSNDYLGLAADQRLSNAFRVAAERWGVGSGASHLVCGHTAAHRALEEALADFTRRPRALLFSSGYAANLGTLSALLDRGDRVFEDRLNHASLLDGGLGSGARFARYAHRDLTDLARRLAAPSEPGRRTLVVSDGTFSMDGTCCDVPGLVAATRSTGAWLMLDEAHSLGVTGRNGTGLVDPSRFGTDDVPVLVGTLGKAFGTHGGFVAGSEELVETLIQHARTYIYSTALPAAVAAATLAALAIVREEDWRRERLRALVTRFRDGASQLGLHLGDSATPIQPILLGEETAALDLGARLEHAGFLVTPIRPPTVPAGSSRLRVTLTAAHTDEDVDGLLSALEGSAREAQVS